MLPAWENTVVDELLLLSTFSRGRRCFFELLKETPKAPLRTSCAQNPQRTVKLIAKDGDRAAVDHAPQVVRHLRGAWTRTSGCINCGHSTQKGRHLKGVFHAN